MNLLCQIISRIVVWTIFGGHCNLGNWIYNFENCYWLQWILLLATIISQNFKIIYSQKALWFRLHNRIVIQLFSIFASCVMQRYHDFKVHLGVRKKCIIESWFHCTRGLKNDSTIKVWFRCVMCNRIILSFSDFS